MGVHQPVWMGCIVRFTMVVMAIDRLKSDTIPSVHHQQPWIASLDSLQPSILKGDSNAEVDLCFCQFCHLPRRRLIGFWAGTGLDHDRDLDTTAGDPFDKVLLRQDADKHRDRLFCSLQTGAVQKN